MHLVYCRSVKHESRIGNFNDQQSTVTMWYDPVQIYDLECTSMDEWLVPWTIVIWDGKAVRIPV